MSFRVPTPSVDFRDIRDIKSRTIEVGGRDMSRILVIDDYPDNVHLLSLLLGDMGHETISAFDGESGVTKALEDQPDLILLDILMPGMDGIETCRRLRSTSTLDRVPVLLISALDQEETVVRGLDAGAQDYVNKPINEQILMARIRAALRIKEDHDRIHTLNRKLAQSNDDLAAFTHVAAHELKAPMRTIKGFASLLEEDIGEHLNEESEQALEFIQGSIARMTNLIDDLLDYSRIGATTPDFRRIDLNQILNELRVDLATILEDSAATIESPALPTLLGNASLVRLLLQNLIHNAIKFQAPNRALRIDISSRQTGRKWEIAIRDNGIGIAPENHDIIFGAFQRLHNRESIEGSGIGLAACRRVVEMHGGEIWVESSPGNGATFYLTLPDQEASSRQTVATRSKDLG